MCLETGQWPDSLLLDALAEDDGRKLLKLVVERLGDLFEPELCNVYARLFSRVIELAIPSYSARELLERYSRIRRPRKADVEPETVLVLSRVTLGADIAVTSVMLDCAKRRFPKARILFGGSKKNSALFAADARIEHLQLDYPRTGGLMERLASFVPLDSPRTIVIDPDSRFTQLGLLPICPEECHYFFESRAYGGTSSASLPELAAKWSEEVFGVAGCPFIAPMPEESRARVALSFGVGENPEKRLPDPFEEQVVRMVEARGLPAVIDKGGGGEETRRVNALLDKAPGIEAWQGDYAPFASFITQADLYIGYDSAGQHVASVAGVPLITAFNGFPSQRFLDRWKPNGLVVTSGAGDAIAAIRAALDALPD
jgi:ADP-heptose:LPS heptosyltransferase